jgi:hypothetical protein
MAKRVKNRRRRRASKTGETVKNEECSTPVQPREREEENYAKFLVRVGERQTYFEFPEDMKINEMIICKGYEAAIDAFLSDQGVGRDILLNEILLDPPCERSLTLKEWVDIGRGNTPVLILKTICGIPSQRVKLETFDKDIQLDQLKKAISSAFEQRMTNIEERTTILKRTVTDIEHTYNELKRTTKEFGKKDKVELI